MNLREIEYETAGDTSDYRRGVWQLLAGATLISFSPVFVRVADVGPTMAGFYRNFFGGVFLLFVVLWRRDAMWRGWVPFGIAAAAAALFAVDLSVWHRSIRYVGPGLATILGNFQIFFLAAFGILVLRERPDWRYLLSIPLALLGLGMLVGLDFASLPPAYRMGVYFGLATALAYACYVLVLQRSQARRVRLPAASNLAAISLISSFVLLVEGLVQGESLRIPDAGSVWAMIAYGVLCQALGWIVISRALVRVPASRVGLILLLQPTLAFVWDILFFARPTGLIDVLGAALAIGAIYLGGSRGRRDRDDAR